MMAGSKSTITNEPKSHTPRAPAETPSIGLVSGGPERHLQRHQYVTSLNGGSLLPVPNVEGRPASPSLHSIAQKLADNWMQWYFSCVGVTTKEDSSPS